MAKNFEHISHIKSQLTRDIIPEEFHGLTPTADNSDAEGSSPVKLNLAKRPTADKLVDGEIAVNYLKGHETLMIKNTENEIVGFVNENELYETQEIIAKGLGKLMEEFDEGIDDLELVISSSLNDLNSRIREGGEELQEFKNETQQNFQNIQQNIDDNELVTSAALNDLNSRINAVEDEVDNLNAKIDENYASLTKVIDDDGLVISSSLNDLNTRLIDVEDMGDRFTNLETMVRNLTSMIGMGYDFVDLGLPSGTLWAKYNVGASEETGYGNYYMYGMGSKTYDSTDTPYAGTESPLSSNADTARQAWGGLWHMPTREQLQELINNTNYEWIVDYKGSGINGGLFTALNGNTIFFPAADCYYEEMGGGSHTPDGSRGIIWSSTPKDNNDAFTLYFSQNNLSVDFSSHITGNGRDSGFSIRPVLG